MKTLFNLISIFALIIALIIISSAKETNQSSGQINLPSANEIFAKFAESIGGKAAAEKIKSRVTKGSAEIAAMNMKGVFEISNKAPNKSLVMLNLTGYGEVVNGFDGTTAWVKDPVQGLRIKSGAEIEQVKLAADFYNDFNLDKTYPQAAVTGIDKIGTADVYVVKADANTTLYFDQQSGFLLRSERMVASQQSQAKVAVRISYEDYREVDGIKRPFTVIQSGHGGDILFKTTEIKQNIEIADSGFAKPN